MCKFIGIEYFVAIAMIQLDKIEISLSDLNKYGISVMRSFKENQIDAVVLYSEKYASELVKDYSDCFILTCDGTVLKRIVSNDVLISKFLAYISTDLIVEIAQNKVFEQAC